MARNDGTIEDGFVRIATAGSVDDGKSTLIGRLLYDSEQIMIDQLEQLADASAVRSGHDEVDLSLLTDGLRAEREQGITIDVAYRNFTTPRRSFILADTPGHVRYTRNMVTGASTADCALVLIDARNGCQQQTRRHLFITSLLRVPHTIVCINKMDLVGYDERVFEQISSDVLDFASRLELVNISFVPVSALTGDNVVASSANMPWYEGTPLLYQLESLQVASDRNLIDVRMPIQWVIRPRADSTHDDRGYCGKMASGVLRAGDEILVLPSGETTRVVDIEVYGESLQEAYPPLAVSVHLADDVDLSRGDMICRPRNRPTISREIDAIVCCTSETAVREGAHYLMKHTTRTVRASLTELVHRIDVDTLHSQEVASLQLNDIGRIRLRAVTPLVFDPYDRNRSTGAFILIDEATNETVAAGMIHGSFEAPVSAGAASRERSINVRWEPERLSRQDRWKVLGCIGATVWITGLPAAGKSTLAAALEEHLVRSGVAAFRLDGDNLRHGLNGNLGFEPPDRAENVRRTAHAAKLLAEAGNIAIVSVVSPYAQDRRIAREVHEQDGLHFIEVFIDTPLAECERRDPKGLYARARAGELRGMTGIDDVYEAPEAPELRLIPSDAPTAIEQVLALLRVRNIVS